MLKHLSVLGVIVLLLLAGCKETPTGSASAPEGKAGAQDVNLETQEQKVSYAVGLDIGTSFAGNGAELDTDALLLGVKDGQAGEEPRLSEKVIRETIMNFQQQMQQKQQEKMKAQSAEQKTASEAFLAEFAQNPDVVTLDSGLMYVVEQEGDGASPANSDIVKVHYRGTTVDGTEFDSSYERGEPVEFQVDRVIPGWTEALQLMQEGDKWQLAIPADLAYGAEGRGGIIPPEAALIFDVELLEVTPAPEGDEK
ncbi:MAG: FKBP-type peptidyl-prolyl cis-trans isomerase [Desulfuromonadaceae bacterium]